MIKKKFIVLAVTVCLVLSGFVLYAYQAKAGNDGGEYAKKYTYSINSLNAEHYPNEFSKFICDKFNIELEIRPINWDDWKQKTRIWVSSGDMPDVLRMDSNAQSFAQYVNWAEQGAFKVIPDEMINKYSNLKRLKESLDIDPYLKVNGKRYAWAASRLSDSINNVSRMMFFYRKDWAKKLDMYHEDNIYTFKEFKEMAKAFVEQDVSGTGDTIGVGGVGWAFPWFAGIYQHQPLWEQYYRKDGGFVHGATQPAMIEGIKEMKEWYNEGILWKDQVVANNDDARNQFVAGKMGMYFTNWTAWVIDSQVRRPFEEATGLNFADAIAPMYVKGPKGSISEDKIVGMQTGDYWSITTFNANMSDEKLERWLEIWDWIASEEGERHTLFGTKDKDWTLIKEGEEVSDLRSPEVANSNNRVKLLWKKNEDGTLQNPSQPRVNPWVFSGVQGGERPEWDTTNPSHLPLINEYIKEINTTLNRDDVYLTPPNLETSYFAGEMKNKYGTFSLQINDKIAELIVSSDDLVADWNAFLETIRPNIEKVTKELNKELN